MVWDGEWSCRIWDIGIFEGELTWVLRFGKGDAEHESLPVITISDNMW